MEALLAHLRHIVYGDRNPRKLPLFEAARTWYRDKFHEKHGRYPDDDMELTIFMGDSEEEPTDLYGRVEYPSSPYIMFPLYKFLLQALEADATRFRCTSTTIQAFRQDEIVLNEDVSCYPVRGFHDYLWECRRFDKVLAEHTRIRQDTKKCVEIEFVEPTS